MLTKPKHSSEKYTMNSISPCSGLDTSNSITAGRNSKLKVISQHRCLLFTIFIAKIGYATQQFNSQAPVNQPTDEMDLSAEIIVE